MAKYRVRVEFETAKERNDVVRRFTDLSGAPDEPSGEGEALLIYADRRDEADGVLERLRGAWTTVGADPVEVAVDEWLADEQRWSDEGKSARLRGFLHDLLDALHGPR